jgi:hypothetical protein
MTFSGLQDVLPREDIIFKPTSARVEMHAKQKKKMHGRGGVFRGDWVLSNEPSYYYYLDPMLCRA